MRLLNTAYEILGKVPGQLWAALFIVTLLSAVVTMPFARRRWYQAGRLTAHPGLATPKERAKNRALLVASLVPAVLFWAMVLLGSFRGLTAFGRDVLKWHGGWEYLVPGTLDGVAIAFGVLAFRAVDAKRAPDRAYRLVWGATVASATINFVHEYHASKSLIGGGYLGLLSLLGIFMLHEFLAQFTDGTQYVKREHPKFGLRWVTSFPDTFCAFLAWRNFPPADGTEASIRNALTNLSRARRIKEIRAALKQAKKHEKALAAANRKAELAAAKTPAAPIAPAVPAHPTELAITDVPIRRASTASSAAAHGDRPSRPSAANVPEQPVRTEVKVPSTANACAAWMDQWIKLSKAHPQFAMARSGIKPDEAQASAGCSDRQARFVRDAARSGQLRAKAAELGVPVPDDYRDQPEDPHRINGSALTAVPA